MGVEIKIRFVKEASDHVMIGLISCTGLLTFYVKRCPYIF